MNFKIRKSRKEDLKEIARIFREENLKKPYWEKYSVKKSIDEMTECMEGELYVAEVEGKVIGFIAAYISNVREKKAYLRELWVSYKFQGKGIGKELTKKIEEIYKKKEIKILRLVSRRDSKAFEFYGKMKYKEYPKLVFMERRLR